MTVRELLRDRFVLGCVAAGVVVVGIFAACWPVRLDAFDRWGFQVTCGTALGADYEQAALADDPPRSGLGPSDIAQAPNGDRVRQCRSAIWWRRAASCTVVAIGAAALLASIPHPRRRRSPGHHTDDPGAGHPSTTHREDS